MWSVPIGMCRVAECGDKSVATWTVDVGYVYEPSGLVSGPGMARVSVTIDKKAAGLLGAGWQDG